LPRQQPADPGIRVCGRILVKTALDVIDMHRPRALAPNDFVERIAATVTACRPGGFLRVAVDGVDGVGRTTFADALGAAVERMVRSVVRASADGFHRSRAVRYRRGRASPTGFYLDSYDYDAMRTQLLDPLGPGGSGRHRRAVFDEKADVALPTRWHVAAPGSALILDGLFLHRPELRAYWDLSVFLDAPFAVTIPRGAGRGPGWGSPDPAAPSNQRYIDGQTLYLRECQPQELAHIVIDYTEISAPRVVTWRI
jgi:uridine kinase